jgi:hypothetical protein
MTRQVRILPTRRCHGHDQGVALALMAGPAVHPEHLLGGTPALGPLDLPGPVLALVAMNDLLLADRAAETRWAAWYIRGGVMTFVLGGELVHIACPATVSELHQMLLSR